MRRDVLSAVGNAVWGTGKGHGGKGQLARHLQRGANETMRRDALIAAGNGKGKGKGLKEAHCWRVRGRRGAHGGAAQEVRGEESGQVMGHPLSSGADRQTYQLAQELPQPARPQPPHPEIFLQNLIP